MKSTSPLKLHKLIKGMSIEKYHSTPDTWSSSQFKDVLDDEEVFINKYIKKTTPRLEIAAFDVGNYFHTGTLEPHKLKDDTVIFPGKVRRGKEWERFKAKNKFKAIVTLKQKEQGVGLIRSVKNSPVAQGYLEGTPEVSLFVKIVVLDGEIYAPFFNTILTRYGWLPIDYAPDLRKGFHLVVKVRADMFDPSYISDLKSTTGNARSNHSMRRKISDYIYDLSAALYLDMFGLLYPSLLVPIFINGVKCARFVWIFASKDFYNSKSYHATETNILVGRAKYMKGLIKMADLAASDWQSVDYIDTLDPLPYELEWLKEKDGDLL